MKEFGVPFEYLRDSPFVSGSDAFVGNMLYCPCVNYETLLHGTTDPLVNRMLSSIGDFRFLETMFESWMKQTSLKDILCMNDEILDSDKELSQLKDVFAKKHHEIYVAVQ